MKKSIVKSLIIVGIFLTSLVMVKSIFAQASIPLTVFPAIQDKVVKLGEKTRLQIQVKNNGETAIAGQIKAADYYVKDKDGTPLIVENSKIKPKYAAASWITPSVNRVTIPANDFISVDLFINVPSEVSTCGKYAIVYFQPDTTPLGTAPSEKASASAINMKIGGLINFSINNKTCKEDLKVTNLTAPSFVEYGPISTQFDLLNMSDTHAAPKGYVMLTNMLGQTVDQKLIEDARIFPEVSRNYKNTLGQTWMFGRYKLTVAANYGANNALKTSAFTYIWVFPIRALIIIILTLAVIIIFVKNISDKFNKKETLLEEEIEKEKEEIEKLKEALKNKKE